MWRSALPYMHLSWCSLVRSGDVHVPHAPPANPPPLTSGRSPPWGGGGHQAMVPPPPKPQFQRKIFFGAWCFLYFLGQVTVPPMRGGGIAKGGGITRGGGGG